MANKHVAVVVRGKIAGNRVNWSLDRAKKERLVGSYWIKWYVGSATQWCGPHKDEWGAKAAKARKERELCSGIAPVTGDVTIEEVVKAFLQERTASQDASSVRRWKWELNRFMEFTGDLTGDFCTSRSEVVQKLGLVISKGRKMLLLLTFTTSEPAEATEARPRRASYR